MLLQQMQPLGVPNVQNAQTNHFNGSNVSANVGKYDNLSNGMNMSAMNTMSNMGGMGSMNMGSVNSMSVNQMGNMGMNGMNASSEDYIPSKLFIGGLSYDTTEESLTQYFSSYGEVCSAIVLRDPVTNHSRGFGFVTFTNEASAKRVLAQSRNHVVDGRKVEAKIAVPRNATNPGQGQGMGMMGQMNPMAFGNMNPAMGMNNMGNMGYMNVPMKQGPGGQNMGMYQGNNFNMGMQYGDYNNNVVYNNNHNQMQRQFYSQQSQGSQNSQEQHNNSIAYPPGMSSGANGVGMGGLNGLVNSTNNIDDYMARASPQVDRLSNLNGGGMNGKYLSQQRGSVFSARSNQSISNLSIRSGNSGQATNSNQNLEQLAMAENIDFPHSSLRRPTYPQFGQPEHDHNEILHSARKLSLPQTQLEKGLNYVPGPERVSPKFDIVDDISGLDLPNLFSNNPDLVRKLCRIYVGGLNPMTTSKSLRNSFEQFGEIVSAEVISDNDNQTSAGYGIIVFAKFYSVQNVLKHVKNDTTLVDQTPVEVKCCLPRGFANGTISNRERSKSSLNDLFADLSVKELRTTSAANLDDNREVSIPKGLLRAQTLPLDYDFQQDADMMQAQSLPKNAEGGYSQLSRMSPMSKSFKASNLNNYPLHKPSRLSMVSESRLHYLKDTKNSNAFSFGSSTGFTEDTSEDHAYPLLRSSSLNCDMFTSVNDADYLSEVSSNYGHTNGQRTPRVSFSATVKDADHKMRSLSFTAARFEHFNGHGSKNVTNGELDNEDTYLDHMRRSSSFVTTNDYGENDSGHGMYTNRSNSRNGSRLDMIHEK